jgi:hypothetical protein
MGKSKQTEQQTPQRPQDDAAPNGKPTPPADQADDDEAPYFATRKDAALKVVGAVTSETSLHELAQEAETLWCASNPKRVRDDDKMLWEVNAVLDDA